MLDEAAGGPEHCINQGGYKVQAYTWGAHMAGLPACLCTSINLRGS